MSMAFETTGRDFDSTTETDRLPAWPAANVQDPAVIGRHLVAHLGFRDVVELPREFEQQVARLVDIQSTTEAERQGEDTYCAVLSGEGISWYRALADATLGIVKESEPPSVRIANATSTDEVVAVLEMNGLDSIAARIRYLHGLPDDDPDEPPFQFESLRVLTRFLIGERKLGRPELAVDPDGLAHAEWKLATGGILAMEFLPSGHVRFAAVSGPARVGVDRTRVSGELPQGEALDAVRSFTALLESR